MSVVFKTTILQIFATNSEFHKIVYCEIIIKIFVYRLVHLKH